MIYDHVYIYSRPSLENSLNLTTDLQELLRSIKNSDTVKYLVLLKVLKETTIRIDPERHSDCFVYFETTICQE